MCGIIGCFARDGRPLDPERVITLRDRMAHRGPDDAGLWRRELQGDVVFGHLRLSIVDVSPGGHQPMVADGGSAVLTFNGEIYNHELLRVELEARGYTFRSRCDSEVLLALYLEHGPAMVDRLVGMFAFAIWDEAEERVFCARDRLGKKPLYFTDDGQTFSFASEIKALLPLLRRREIDPTSLAHYLTFVAVPPPRTLFAGVSKLAPASWMIVDREGPRTPVRYWDPLSNRADFDGAEVDWEVELRTRLEVSVDRRLMSDVPVGIFLSGGVDSSTNVALMSRLVDEPVRTFSIGYEGASGKSHNEFDWARRVADMFGTEHHETRIDVGDMWGFMADLVHHQDEPIADPVCVPLYFVSKLAKENGVTVVHVGEGADEILAGYASYVQAHQVATTKWRQFRRLPPQVRSAVAMVGSGVLGTRPGYETHAEALRRGGQRDGELWWGGAVAFYEQSFDRVTTPELRRQIGGERPRDVVAAIAADADRHGARDELDRLIYQDLRLRLPELLLMRVDKLTMANSIEARAPFLDHELVELAMAMPASEKIRDGIGKHVLKRAVSDLLPQDLLWRPKQGFGTPVSEWFRGDGADELDRRLTSSKLRDLGWIDPARVTQLVEQHRSGRAERSFQLWNLLNLSAWFDHWIAGEEAIV